MFQPPPLFRNQLLQNVLSSKRLYLLDMARYNPIGAEDKTEFLESAIQRTYGSIPSITGKAIRFRYNEMPITLPNGKSSEGVEVTFLVDYTGSIDYFGYNPTSLSGAYRPNGSVTRDALGLVYHTDDPSTDFEGLLRKDLAIIEEFLNAVSGEVEAEITSLRPVLYDYINDRATRSERFREALSKLPFQRV